MDEVALQPGGWSLELWSNLVYGAEIKQHLQRWLDREVIYAADWRFKQSTYTALPL